jgi:hypothetical protein
MASASWALQQAIHQVLTASTAVTSLLGGAHVYDHVPRGQAYPYVTFGATSERDWSTGTEDGGEHIVTLHVWSKAAGRHEADHIAAAVRAALHDKTIPMTGFRLVNLRQEIVDVRRETADEIYHGVVRLRAVTEPVA